jgi:hypothetical protein
MNQDTALKIALMLFLGAVAILLILLLIVTHLLPVHIIGLSG